MHESNNTSKKIKVARIVSVPSFFVHSIANFEALRANGFELDLICSEESYGEYLKETYGFNVIYSHIERDISLKKDLTSLVELTQLLKKNHYDIVHSATPKAGIITALAAFMARSPVRLHTFTGQRWATLHGFKRWLLKTLDKIVILLNTRCYTDSPSQIDYLVAEGVAKKTQLDCLGKGSYGGVNLEKFNRALYPASRSFLADKFKIDPNIPWILFVGRLTRDKGINELVRAFLEAKKESPANLVLVGAFEPKLDPIDSDVQSAIEADSNIHFLGFQKNPAEIMSACDFMCLPSYREGFGTVIIEAAACELPTIGTEISGLVDAIVPNKTGLLIAPKNQNALKVAMLKLIKDPSQCKSLGVEAKKRAEENFNTTKISEALIQSYRDLLS